MVVQVKALNCIRHNGKLYNTDEIIPEIDSDCAEKLVKSKAAEYVKSQENPNKANNINPEPAGSGGTPVQGNSDPDKTKVPAYADMTNAEQIQYLSCLSDEDFTKRYDELISYSKSKSKTYAERRFKLTQAGADAS